LKKYSFRLQTVLNMREKALETKRLEMAKVISILNVQVEKLENLTNKKEVTKDALNEIYAREEEIDIFGITNYKNFLSKITNDVRVQEGVIENTRTILKIKQKEVNNALKEVKVLEKLKEQQEKKFYQHYEYVQAKEIDDISSTRYNRAIA